MNTQTTEPTKAEKVQSLIDGAQGAVDMIQTTRFCKWIFHTDSLDFVCEAAGSYWFLDVIVSYLPKLAKRGAKFQVWQMTVKNREARIWCEDGDGNKLLAQRIPYTDFPLPEFKVFCEYGSVDGQNPAYIIMLPGDR